MKGMDTNDGERLLAGIIEEPGDDALRLVYADWLEEEGQAERAEFIRVQVELTSPGLALHASLPPGSTHLVYPSCQGCLRVQALRRRESRLWGLWTFAPPIPPGFRGELHGEGQGKDIFVRRGFAWKVRCPLQAWLDHGAAICAAHPVEVVGISDKEPYEDDLDLWYWFLADRGTAQLPDYLPALLFDLLPGQAWEDGGLVWKEFDSREAADAALSRACILHARSGKPAARLLAR